MRARPPLTWLTAEHWRGNVTTLDGEEILRVVAVICDGEQPVALERLMGTWKQQGDGFALYAYEDPNEPGAMMRELVPILGKGVTVRLRRHR